MDATTSTSTSITHAAREKFAPAQIALMRDTVAKDCTVPEFHFFLEVCARYEFNPFLGEIYAAKMPGKNGGAGSVAIIVGRNGWLKEANRQPDFKDLDSDVVRANDLYSVVRGPDGHRHVHHEIKGNHRDRGEIVGAWAEVTFNSGRKPVLAYAPLEEYMPTSEKKLAYSPWGKQLSVMIEKCAIVIALRTAFNIGGVYDEAELAHARQATGEPVVAPEIEWGEDPETASTLQSLVATANDLVPGSYLPEKVRLKLDGADDDRRHAFADELQAFIEARGGTPEGTVADAEVVS